MIITKGFKPEDRERLHAINEACYSGVQRSSPVQFDDMLMREVFVARVDHDLIPGIEGTIVGFAIVRSDPAGNTYLWSLAVDPAYRGRGVGGNLLREVIKYYTLARATEIALHVKPDNPAQKLYFDYGFRVQSVIRDWYGKEGNALYMWRALP